MLQIKSVGPPVRGGPEFSPLERPGGEKSGADGEFAVLLKAQNKGSTGDPVRAKGQKSNVLKPSERRPDDTSENELLEGPGVRRADPLGKRAEAARKNAIQNFMDSFESEFGIPPTRIVEAMANLEPHKLRLAPEETAREVILQLDLPPEDRDRAMQMYVSLLEQLRQIDLSLQPPMLLEQKPQVLAGAEVLTRHAQTLERRHAMNNGVEALTRKFWMHFKADQPESKAKVIPASSIGLEERLWNLSAEQDEMGEIAELSGHLSEPTSMTDLEAVSDILASEDSVSPEVQAVIRDLAARGELDQMDEKEMRQLIESLRKAESEAGVNTPQELRLYAKQILMKRTPVFEPSSIALTRTESSPAPSSSEPVGAGRPLALTAAMAAALDAVSGQSSSKGGGSENNGWGESGQNRDRLLDLRSLSLQSELTQPSLSQGQDNSTVRAFEAILKGGTPTVAKEMPDVNINQIINQAQYLIKKGGGEMRVKLYPEGLGSMDLKVQLQDGRVQIQMATENPEAKRSLEGKLSELRQSLSAQKLALESVKIDVVSSTNTERNAQSSMDYMNQQQQRQGAQEFWGQFQNQFGNRFRREGYFDIPSIRRGDEGGRSGLEPISSSSQSSVQSRKDPRRGKRLDLVA
ncbi:MAG: flagellar hook-length control protein FliK [Bdellovibrionaceae bacterium]|nr:flagellar hook-length control protein FliK [Pseudobdellovibrionaceae bacterium]